MIKKVDLVAKKKEYFLTNNMDFPVVKKNDDTWAKVNV